MFISLSSFIAFYQHPFSVNCFGVILVGIVLYFYFIKNYGLLIFFLKILARGQEIKRLRSDKVLLFYPLTGAKLKSIERI